MLAHVQSLHLPEQGLSRDAEGLCRHPFPPVTEFEGLPDGSPLCFLNVLGEAHSPFRFDEVRGIHGFQVSGDRRRGGNEFEALHSDVPLYRILQFPHVAGPIVTHESLEDLPRHGGGVSVF